MLIALGNTARGDDGVGPAIGARVAAIAPEIETHVLGALTPECAPLLARVSQVVFVDAAATGVPGTIAIGPVPVPDSAPVVHDLCAGDVLALTKALYGLAPVAYQVTIAGERFEPGVALSPPVAAAVEPAAAAVVALLRRWNAAGPGHAAACGAR